MKINVVTWAEIVKGLHSFWNSTICYLGLPRARGECNDADSKAGVAACSFLLLFVFTMFRTDQVCAQQPVCTTVGMSIQQLSVDVVFRNLRVKVSNLCSDNVHSVCVVVTCLFTYCFNCCIVCLYSLM